MRSPRGCDAPLKARLQDPRSFNQPRSPPVNTSYPQLSRSTSLQLLLAINTAYDGKGLFKQDE